MGTQDSLSLLGSFLKIIKTSPVDPWNRSEHHKYIDLSGQDSAKFTFVEVGLFVDSTISGQPKHAALIVNTRLQPSLRDSEDISYYNAGMATKDQAQSTLGDIDVRKIFMMIDTLQLESSFRSPYYVVRDLWHPDTTWLVKADSQFAVYIKPGDAKFLYFEKEIAITAAMPLPIGLMEC